MNIFETIDRTTTRIEPFHSQFLADAPKDSIGADRSLFDAVWAMVAPGNWSAPTNAEIQSEQVVTEQRRIDIFIRCDSPKRIVGMEVKTTDSSATPGQLKLYYEGLTKKHNGYDVAITYLTPFNRKWAKDKADSLPTVKEFECFERECPNAFPCHVSWLDIAAVPWNGNELWRQHQLYVLQHISSVKKLQISTTRDRSLDEFFGGEAVEAFWESLSALDIPLEGGSKDIEIKLAQFDHTPDFATRLAHALQNLIREGDGIVRNARKNEFDDRLRGRFLTSSYREIHEALFGLAEADGVWLKEVAITGYE